MADPITREQVLQFLSEMPIIELVELTRELETRWGMVGTRPMFFDRALPMAFHTNGDDEPWQTEFTVTLVAVPRDRRLTAIKVTREVLGIGLQDAKHLIDHFPVTIKADISKAEADEIRQKYTAVGATAEVH